MPDLSPLIGYIIDQVQDMGGTVGKTALMKLIYLADVDYYQRYGRSATGLNWRFYHYGPYAVELEAPFRSLGLDFSEREFTAGTGAHQVSGYRYSRTGDWRNIRSRFNSEFDASVGRAVDRVVERWATETLWSILDYVYFETEPMQGADRGEYLDFSKINKEINVGRTTAKLSLSRQAIDDLKGRIAERKQRSGREIRKPTEPTYDDLYAEASKLMGEEEGRISNVKPHTKLQRPGQE